MEHDGALLLAVGVNVGEIEVLGHLEVQLNGAALQNATQRVLQVEVDLRTVEGAVALVDDIVHAKLSSAVLGAGLRASQSLVRTHQVIPGRVEAQVMG